MIKKPFSLSILGLALGLVSGATYAQKPQLNVAGWQLEPTAELTYGMFYSDKSYNNPEPEHAHPYWHEVYAKYGAKAEYTLNNSAVYASLVGISSATLGDGDAAGFTTGDEHKTSVEEWVLGWKNAKDDTATLDVSIGRQNVQLADGFMLAGDALNLGQGIAEGALDRGGAYYLAARRSFDVAGVVKYQPIEGLNTTWMYLESGNKAQYEPTLFAADGIYQQEKYGVGLSYLQILDVKDPFEESVRDDLKNIAIRGNTQLNESLNLSGEFVHQDQKHEDENAWYIRANYDFKQLPYQPSLSYRYSSFSEQYDPLFYGNTDAGFGTWFQGEVAANYAGPFSKNTRIHQLALQASVQENLHLGAIAYQFDTIKKEYGNLDGHELDFFAVWSPQQNISIMPLLGIYKPKKDLSEGGTQRGDDKTNVYGQLLVQYLY